MNINEQLAKELGIRVAQVDATVQLIDEGNTIPFIARYRKEVTGSLNDEVLRNLYERLTYLRNLEERKNSVLSSIEEQGKLTEELKKQIMDATTLVVVEDLYRPYKQKRRTRATVAKEKGLEPLAEIILAQDADRPIAEYAVDFINEEKEVKTAEEAIAGASDIIAEKISDEADYRIHIRKLTGEEGLIVSEAKDEKAQSVYENYYKYSEKISTILGHRVLALNRGEDEKFLTVKIEAPVDSIIAYLEMRTIKKDNPYTNDILKAAIADAYDRLIAPAIEREIRSDLTEKAQDSAIKVFGKNLTQLLMQPPIAGHFVLGWDPAFRTGCKLAVVDPTGKVLDTVVIYPTAPQFKVDEAKRILKNLIAKYNITLISVGNGTASRESEQIIVELLHEINKKDLAYIITNEAGASVYSASKLATEEFPNFDVGQRSAASIARRVQDPLAELVKIDPKSIGVGQYQHDMNQKKLGEQLEGVVEDCVNKVGVDVNTASASLLEYVSGISKPIAKNIVAYREENGRFLSRAELLKVPKLGPKAFEQCAGFLRIRGGKNPLDNTSVHPESYEAAKKLLDSLGFTPQDIKTLQAEQAKAVKEDEAKRREEEDRAEREAKAAGKNRDRRNKNDIQVRNADSAMGKLLAQALAKSGKNVVTRDNQGSAGLTDKNIKSGAGSASGILSQSETASALKGGAGLSHLGSMIKNKKQLAEELGIGEITLDDIIKELEKPGRDPRKDMPAPILRQDVLEMKDLKEGMVLKGTVRNVIDFGVFVDIGVHQDGLVHISQITNKKYIKHPLELLSVGDVVDVKVMSVDLQKKRIQLTMIM